MNRLETQSTDINCLALVKEKTGERYIFLFTDANRAAVLRKIGEFASNPSLRFTWLDAAVLSGKIHKGEYDPQPE